MINLNTLARGAIMAAIVATPLAASAQSYDAPRSDGYYHHHRYASHSHYRTCGADQRRRANNGTAIGAVSGGVLGSALGGGKFGNVLLGAGAGAVAGHEIGKHTAHC